MSQQSREKPLLQYITQTTLFNTPQTNKNIAVLNTSKVRFRNYSTVVTLFQGKKMCNSFRGYTVTNSDHLHAY